MAVGDSASAAGYPLVPNSGENGRVRYGAREINRTRDMIADLEIRFGYGTQDPANHLGNEGDIFFKLI